MKHISKELAIEIGALALWFTQAGEFEKYYEVTVGGSTLYRDFKHSDLLCSIMFTEKESIGTDRRKGVHLNIMQNGDVFARNYPYYDGSLELIPVFNQRKIFEMVEGS